MATETKRRVKAGEPSEAVSEVEVRYTVIGKSAPFRVQKEYWKANGGGQLARVFSKPQPGRFATQRDAQDWANGLLTGTRSGAPPRAGRTKQTAEERAAKVRQNRIDRKLRDEALEAELEAILSQQRG